MKGLSFSQPWLWAVHDEVVNKDIENREWQAPIDQIEKPFATHAAKSFDDNGLHSLLTMDGGALRERVPSEMTKSAITGIATIDRIVSNPSTLTKEQRRWYMGDYHGMRDGKQIYGHVLKDRRTLPKPIPWDGALGFWELPPLVEAEIGHQLMIGTIVGAWTACVLEACSGKLADFAGDSLAARTSRFVEVNPGHHLYFKVDGVESCAICARFKPKETAKKKPPCKGVLPLSVRPS